MLLNLREREVAGRATQSSINPESLRRDPPNPPLSPQEAGAAAIPTQPRSHAAHATPVAATMEPVSTQPEK